MKRALVIEYRYILLSEHILGMFPRFESVDVKYNLFVFVK